ncbi:MAG: hypothetical protein DYG93_07350 [Leptolyngbya sp. PLA2]|nr:hypothetical protein [Leptolyngbya sp.]MCE7971463.1 hypothetical protein [Leptolyngbya sp. PL-A2]MCQ3940678.1 hypothetical protein [cyanobacterium CYA1]MCZ7632326.1 hypothetical protein [Phycisphaerales bacterium]MDL1903647.1 hypothetical protein [Synechococcales cyanobacterium CNB]GIK18398.1 MAG: hypothetical protein BroJett004_05620 [Planctomycetota bacterium]
MVRHITHRPRPVAALGLAFAAGLALTSARVVADNTGGSAVAIQVDKKDQFTARGLFQSTDTDDPRDGINRNGGGGVSLAIVGVNWSFNIHHVVHGWDLDKDGDDTKAGVDGAEAAQVGVGGMHLDGPHEGDVDPNTLPLVPSAISLNIKYGEAKKLAAWGITQHEIAKGPHFDGYGVVSMVTATQAPRRVSGDAIVRAKHSKNAADVEAPSGWLTAGASQNAGTVLYFDPFMNTLTVVTSGFDILDRDGGRTLDVDPAYRNDPILNVPIEIIQMQLVGHQPEVGWIFVPILPFRLQGWHDGFGLEGTLGRLIISDHRSAGATLYAPFMHLSVADGVAGDPGSSPFMSDLMDVNIAGEGLSEEQWMETVGPGIAIVPVGDLVAATGGFTMPASMPATLLLTAVPAEPDGHACPADFNGDTVINTLDVLAFLNAYVALDPRADFNGDTVINTLDVLAFLNAYTAGCD